MVGAENHKHLTSSERNRLETFRMSRLRLCFVGCGQIAVKHYDAIKLVNANSGGIQIAVVACVDTNPESARQFAAVVGASHHGTSFQQALKETDFDAVFVLVPHNIHEEIAYEVFDAKKHLFLEKPIAPTVDACHRIWRASQKSDKVFMVGEQSQFWPEILKAKQLIEEGVIGDIVTARSRYAEVVPIERGWRNSMEASGGGLAMDGGPHWIRPLRMIMGEVAEVMAVTSNIVPQCEGETLVYSMLRFKSGKVGVFECLATTGCLAPQPWFQFTGTKGEIVIDGSFDGGIRVFDSQQKFWGEKKGEEVTKIEGWEPMAPHGFWSAFVPQIHEFAKACLDGAPLTVPPYHSVGELMLTLAVYKSAASRQWEPVGVFDPSL